MDTHQNTQPLQLENWLPLESNSDVLNNYLGVIGANNELIRFYDVVSLDKESLIYIPQPIVGALFVFPDSPHINHHFFDQGEEMFKVAPPKSIYYMKQVAENACGTISLLHSLINILDEYPFILEPESFVESFLQDTISMTPEQRAEYLNACKKLIKKKDGTTKSLQEAHKDAVEEAGEINDKDKVYHHFISFVWREGKVIELDGRKKAPIVYTECQQEQFMERVFEICLKHYVEKDETNSGFNLMALSIG